MTLERGLPKRQNVCGYDENGVGIHRDPPPLYFPIPKEGIMTLLSLSIKEERLLEAEVSHSHLCV